MRIGKLFFIIITILCFDKVICQNMIVNFNAANPNEIEITDIKKILVNETSLTITTISNGNDIYNLNTINNCIFSNAASIEEDLIPNSISLFPNPFENQFQISSNFPIEDIKMIDFYNREIEVFKIQINHLTYSVKPHSDLCKGLYVIIITAGGKNYSKIIQNF
jgi:hypothetical protein